MMKMKWAAAAALFAVSTGALADGTYEFDKITKIAGLTVTGVLVNDTAPTSLTGTSYSCMDWFLLMMTQPGMFTLKVDLVTFSQPPMPTSIYIRNCELTAKT